MTGIEYMNTICPTTSAGREPNREDVADAFEDGVAEGAKWKQSQGVGLGYLIDWYMASVDETETPIWTEEHLKELLKDFIIIPKSI